MKFCLLSLRRQCKLRHVLKYVYNPSCGGWLILEMTHAHAMTHSLKLSRILLLSVLTMPVPLHSAWFNVHTTHHNVWRRPSPWISLANVVLLCTLWNIGHIMQPGSRVPAGRRTSVWFTFSVPSCTQYFPYLHLSEVKIWKFIFFTTKASGEVTRISNLLWSCLHVYNQSRTAH